MIGSNRDFGLTPRAHDCGLRLAIVFDGLSRSIAPWIAIEGNGGGTSARHAGVRHNGLATVDRELQGASGARERDLAHRGGLASVYAVSGNRYRTRTAFRCLYRQVPAVPLDRPEMRGIHSVPADVCDSRSALWQLDQPGTAIRTRGNSHGEEISLIVVSQRPIRVTVKAPVRSGVARSVCVDGEAICAGRASRNGKVSARGIGRAELHGSPERGTQRRDRLRAAVRVFQYLVASRNKDVSVSVRAQTTGSYVEERAG